MNIMRQRRDSARAMVGSLMLVCAGLIGCSGVSAQTASVNPELVGTEAYRVLAGSYHKQAEEKYAEAAIYQHRADSQSGYTDPKGFVRGGFITAASVNRAEARDLEQMAAMYEGTTTVTSQ